MLVDGGFFAGFSIRFQIKLRIDDFECHLAVFKKWTGHPHLIYDISYFFTLSGFNIKHLW